jgi:hypothetical protein
VVEATAASLACQMGPAWAPSGKKKGAVWLGYCALHDLRRACHRNSGALTTSESAIGSRLTSSIRSHTVRLRKTHGYPSDRPLDSRRRAAVTPRRRHRFLTRPPRDPRPSAWTRGDTRQRR